MGRPRSGTRRQAVSVYACGDGLLYKIPHEKRSLRRVRRGVTIPPHVSEPVRLYFAEMQRLHITYDELAECSGIRRATAKAHRRKNRPSLESLSAILGSLGWTFIPQPALEIIPEDVRPDLERLAEKLKVSIPDAFSAVVDLAARQQQHCIESDQRLAAIDARRQWAANYKPTRRRRRKPANDNTSRQAAA